MNNIITKFFASLLAYRVANKKKRFSAIGHFSEGLAPARGKIQWGYIDKENQEILPFKYDIAEPFYNNIARVGLYGKSMKIKNRTMNVYKQPLYTLLIHLNADDILF